MDPRAKSIAKGGQVTRRKYEVDQAMGQVSRPGGQVTFHRAKSFDPEAKGASQSSKVPC